LEGFLVGLDREQIVAALLVEDLLGGLLLRVQGIGDHGFVHQILRAQQLTRGGDLIGLGGGHHAAQKPTGAIDGVDDLHPAVAHLLAIHNHQPILRRSQELSLPAQEHPLQRVAIDAVQEAREGRFLGAAHVVVGVQAKP
jgi:hypothetical protein